MSSVRELGDDHPSHEEIIDMKVLLKTLVDSQTKLAETQANIQHEMMDILRSSRNYESDKGKGKDDQRKSSSSEEDTDINDIIDQEILQVPDDYDVRQSSIVEDDNQVATYYPHRHRELNDALVKSDWGKANEYLRKNPEAIKEGLTSESYTVLHTAIFVNNRSVEGMEFVEGIVKLMPPEVLKYKTECHSGYTALHLAAKFGNTKAAELMVNKNPKLPQIRSTEKGWVPLQVAVRNVTVEQKEIVKYLYSVTKDVDPSPFRGQKGAELLCAAVDANFYDLALCLIKQFPKLVIKKSEVHDMCALELLVRQPYAFPSGTKLTWWQNYIYSLIGVNPTHVCDYHAVHTIERDEENPPEILEGIEAEEPSTTSWITFNGIYIPYFTRAPHIKKIYNQKLVHEQAKTLLKYMIKDVRSSTANVSAQLGFFRKNPNIVKVSIKHGIIEFIEKFVKSFSYLSYRRLPDQNMLEMAVAERNEVIVNFICKYGDKCGKKINAISRKDNNNNTILHHAAKLATPAQLSLISGVAFQIQRELQWFKVSWFVFRRKNNF
ncbi:hypothetical protein MKX01_027988 [Papaver californicum]|nr:hypothetical protein MKX01_027988 [Papaver californicum]